MDTRPADEGRDRAGAGGPQAGPHLSEPDVSYQASFLAALGEYHGENRHLELDLGVLAARDCFAQYCQALRDDVAHPGAPERFVLRACGIRLEPPEDGHVPQTTLWWVEGGEYLGRVNIRHRLTRSLLWRGGTIGYEMRPSARGRGHATAMLGAALPVAAALGIREARIDCDVVNVASRRVIEKNGGVFEREEHGSLFYLVPTA
jgi:hypothetical protein